MQIRSGHTWKSKEMQGAKEGNTKFNKADDDNPSIDAYESMKDLKRSFRPTWRSLSFSIMFCTTQPFTSKHRSRFRLGRIITVSARKRLVKN